MRKKKRLELKQLIIETVKEHEASELKSRVHKEMFERDRKEKEAVQKLNQKRWKSVRDSRYETIWAEELEIGDVIKVSLGCSDNALAEVVRIRFHDSGKALIAVLKPFDVRWDDDITRTWKILDTLKRQLPDKEQEKGGCTCSA